MGVFPCGFSFVVNGAIDMYDKSLIAHLLPPEMIIKNYIHGDPDCNYEKYLLEFVNASDFFRVKSDGDIYQSPESEENGQCDCISTSYQFDFKLIASKTALQARSILYPSKTEIVKGIIVTSEPKVKNGSIKATRIHAALRGYDFEGLRELRITAIKKQGVENDLIELLETLETRKHLLLFFPYKFEFKTKHEFLIGITQIQNALNSDFRCAMQYRTHEVGADFDTYVAYKAVGMFENVSGLKISDYWPTFQKKVNQQSIVHFPDYISEISSALANGSLSLSERWIRKLLSKVLHYVGIKDEAEKEYGSISIKRYISNSFPQIYQSSILSLSQIHDFSYSAVEKKVKEIFASLLGDGWLEIIPDSFMQPVREPQVASEDSHILYDESSISIVFDTVYGVKGETHDATLYLETETKKSSDIRRILPLLERKITQCKNELQEKSRRCIYVGFSRPKYLLCLAISEKTYVGHETAFSSWKIVDLRSEDAM